MKAASHTCAPGSKVPGQGVEPNTVAVGFEQGIAIGTDTTPLVPHSFCKVLHQLIVHGRDIKKPIAHGAQMLSQPAEELLPGFIFQAVIIRQQGFQNPLHFLLCKFLSRGQAGKCLPQPAGKRQARCRQPVFCKHSGPGLFVGYKRTLAGFPQLPGQLHCFLAQSGLAGKPSSQNRRL